MIGTDQQSINSIHFRQIISGESFKNSEFKQDRA